MKIILASASPRRRELMRFITADFEAVATECDETLQDGTDPLKASEYLALIKAKAASSFYPDDIIIGCDTTVICDGCILGKPKDKEMCISYMERLSGKTHKVVSGCAIVYKDKVLSFSDVTDVTFRKLTQKEIEDYASTPEPYDKAGGYGIQGNGSELISCINGDFFNVVGLPVTKLFNELKKFINDIKEK